MPLKATYQMPWNPIVGNLNSLETLEDGVFNDSERGGRRNPESGLTTGLDRIDDQCTLKNKSRVPRYLAQLCLKNSYDFSDIVVQPQLCPFIREATRNSTH